MHRPHVAHIFGNQLTASVERVQVVDVSRIGGICAENAAA
jgi:hypothetical protein